MTDRQTDRQTDDSYNNRVLALEKENARLRSQLSQQKYGLVWIDVPEGFEKESENRIPILEEVPEKAIHNPDGKPCHILIEGDNYHALTCLNYTHRGRVDVIYIDPPYNTGSDGFTYRDRRFTLEKPDGTPVPKDHPLRHSYWLSFMSKRLELAKNLLSDRGVIFISIDDNEQANLKLLCNQIFGEENFIAQVIWERAFSPVNLKKHFSESHDYILCYCKQIANLVCNGLPRNNECDERYSNPDNDPRGPWTSSDMTVGPVVPNKLYDIQTPTGTILHPASGRCWLYTLEVYEEMKKDNRIWFGASGNNMPRVKKFLSEVKQGMTPMTVWKYAEVGHSQDATKGLKDIFGGKASFDYPKPVDLIKRCIQLYSNENSTILDFFAGSGTTLHATMKLNAEDGGHRQCILVQLDENGICENVTYERNRRVIQGYTNSKGESVPGLGNSLKYYRTAFVGKNPPRKALDSDRLELALKAGNLLALAENTLFERERTGAFQIFTDEATPRNVTAIYFLEDIDLLEEFQTRVETLAREAGRVAVYIFSWDDGSVYDSMFDACRNVEVKPIPQPILEIYQTLQ